MGLTHFLYGFFSVLPTQQGHHPHCPHLLHPAPPPQPESQIGSPLEAGLSEWVTIRASPTQAGAGDLQQLHGRRVRVPHRFSTNVSAWHHPGVSVAI